MSQEIIKQVEGEIAPLTARAIEMAKVMDSVSEANAVDFLVQIKKMSKSVDDQRSFLVKPLNDHVKDINGKFKPFLAALSDAETIVKKGMSDYRQSEEFKALEEKRQTLEQEGHLAVQEGDVKALEEIGKAHQEASLAAPKSVQSEGGKAHFRMVKRFEIENASIVPREFLAPDEKKIKSAIEAGAIIEGVKVWEEKLVVIR